MWRGVTVGKPFLGGATMVQAGHHNQKFVCYPDQPRPRREGRGADQLDLRSAHGRRRHAAARGLEPAGQACRLPAALRGLEVRLARRAGRHPRGARHLRIPHGRSRSAAALVARPRHACWATPRIRCIPSAPTAPRRRSSTARRSPRNFWPAAIRKSALQRYEQRRLPPTARIVESNRRKGIDVMLDIVEQRAPQGFSEPRERAAGRRAGEDRRRLQEARAPRTARRCCSLASETIKNRPLRGPAVVAVYTGHHIAGRHRERLCQKTMTGLWQFRRSALRAS